MTSWITEDVETSPCPECGRIYTGKFSQKECGIKIKEIKKLRKNEN